VNISTFSIPPLVLKSIFEIERISQAPQSLIVSAHLSAISIACQHVLRVRRPGGQEGPVSLSFIDVVPSGERKTTVYKDVFHPIQSFQCEDEARVEPQLEKYHFARQEWEAKLKEMYRQKAELQRSGECVQAFEDEIEQLLFTRPQRPKSFKLIMQDATPEAVIQRLHEEYPTAAIVSPEGGVVLDSALFRSLGLFNSLWSSEDIEVVRKTTKTMKITDPSFSVTIAVQEKVLQKFLKRKGSEIHDSGFMSRFLVSKAVPKRGYRTISGETFSRLASDEFKARITEILKTTHIADGPAIKYVMEFAPAAHKPWVDYFNETEVAQAPGGPLYDVAEAASKSAEQAARISAILQYFEHGPSPINVINAQRGVDIARAHLVQHKEMFGAKPEISQDEFDAASLEHWLWKRCQRYGGMPCFRRNEILKFGPAALRNTARREAALIFMVRAGRVRLEFRNKTTFVNLNPQFFPVQNPPAWLPPSFSGLPPGRL
jgi:hypothetical protein